MRQAPNQVGWRTKVSESVEVKQFFKIIKKKEAFSVRTVKKFQIRFAESNKNRFSLLEPVKKFDFFLGAGGSGEGEGRRAFGNKLHEQSKHY